MDAVRKVQGPCATECHQITLGQWTWQTSELTWSYCQGGSNTLFTMMPWGRFLELSGVETLEQAVWFSWGVYWGSRSP